MKKERVVPKKNYLYLLLMIVGVVVLTLFIFNLNNKYQNRKLEKSYLDGYINSININEIDNILTEPNSETFIFLTSTNNIDVYKLEVEMKNFIRKHNLRDNFIMIDYTNNDVDFINKKFKTNIKSVPAIIYLKNGEFVKSIDSSDNILSIGDVEKLIEEYEVK